MKNTRVRSSTSHTQDTYIERNPLVESLSYSLDDTNNSATLNMNYGVAYINVNRLDPSYEGGYTLIINSGENNENFTIYNNSLEDIALSYKGSIIYTCSPNSSLRIVYKEDEDKWIDLNQPSLASPIAPSSTMALKSFTTQISWDSWQDPSNLLQTIVTIDAARAFYGFDLWASPNVDNGLSGNITIQKLDSTPLFGPFDFTSTDLNDGSVFRQTMNNILDIANPITLELKVQLTSGTYTQGTLNCTTYFQDEWKSYVVSYNTIQSNLPLGVEVEWAGTNTPNGYIKEIGTVIPNAQTFCPDFIRWLQDHDSALPAGSAKRLLIPLATYQALLASAGEVHNYAISGTTLYFPKVAERTTATGVTVCKMVCINNLPEQLVASPQPSYVHVTEVANNNNENTTLKIIHDNTMVGDGTVSSPLTVSPSFLPLSIFGARINKTSNYGAQLAETDGIIEGYFTGGDNARITFYNDSNTDPTTLISYVDSDGGNVLGMPFSFTVAKNEYWKIVLLGSAAIGKCWFRPISLIS